jgi:hypothetical protein
MLQLTSKGLVLHGELDALRDRFVANHCLVLKQLLEPALLEKIQRRIDQRPWHGSTFEDFGTELTLKDPETLRLVLFLLNHPAFLNVIRAITSCAQISEFRGRVYRLVAGRQHQLTWHGDTKDDRTRRVGFSLNLSTGIFHGGTFELRDRWTLAQLAHVNNTGFGDALLFPISYDLQHRVTEVRDTVAKTACAGWFHANAESFFGRLRPMSQ